MRGTRGLLLLAILAILSGIGVTYRAQKKALQKQSPAKPPLLPLELSGFGTSLTGNTGTRTT